MIDGDETLGKVSRPVENFDERLFLLLDDMRDTLIEQNGVGLAAVQVGVLRNIFILFDPETEVFTEFINPEIIAKEGEQRVPEGCLSCPQRFGIVVRPQKVVVRAADRFGREFEYSGEDLMAKAVCHEYDHLLGILFTSKVVEWVEN